MPQLPVLSPQPAELIMSSLPSGKLLEHKCFECPPNRVNFTP